MMAENAHGCGAMSTNSTSSRSPGNGALDEHWPGQRVDCAERQRGEIGHGGRGVQIAIQRVARLERNRLTRVDLHDRHQVRVPPVVAGVRLLVEMRTAIDGDALGGSQHAPWSSLVVGPADK